MYRYVGLYVGAVDALVDRELMYIYIYICVCMICMMYCCVCDGKACPCVCAALTFVVLSCSKDA